MQVVMRQQKLLGRDEDEREHTKLLLRDLASDDEDGHDYDSALELAGYGRFHYWLAFICGWANASDAVEILCISFLLPSAECDLELTPARKGWLSAILFVGMMIGGYIWGSLADSSMGRRVVLINAMIVNAAAGVISSFSQDFYFFLILRFLSGVGVGGSIPVVWTYFGEFQPSDKRGAALSVLATFWMVGNIAVAALAWAVIPHDIGWSDPAHFQYNSWRVFVALCAVPSFLVAIALLRLPESPRFLLSQGKPEKALSVLKNMHRDNGGKAGSYPVSSLLAEGPGEGGMTNEKKSFKATAIEAIDKSKQLFSSSFLRYTIIMVVINFTIQFGYYGLWLWFPELFNKLNLYYSANPNATVSVCEVIDLQVETTDVGTNCKEYIPDDSVFINSFIISISAGPSNLWTIFHMDKLGRKFFLVFSMLLSGCSAFLIYFVNSSTMNLVISCVFGAVSTMGFNSLDCLGVELFPTHLRSTAMAVTLVAARFGAILGNLVFGYFVETSCAVPIFAVATLLIGGGLMGLLLPNTTKKALLDV